MVNKEKVTRTIKVRYLDGEIILITVWEVPTARSNNLKITKKEIIFGSAY